MLKNIKSTSLLSERIFPRQSLMLYHDTNESDNFSSKNQFFVNLSVILSPKTSLAFFLSMQNAGNNITN